MKLTAWTPGVRTAALLILATTFAISTAGCGKKRDRSGSSDAKAITLPKKFNTPPGADPSVSAELGGNGFEKIAADSGWQTSAFTAEELNYVVDTTAQKGGTVTFGLTDFPATFRDFGKDGNSETSTYLSGMTHMALIGTNPLTLGFLPSLASHWKVGADSQTYFFRLNPNARFHDGAPVTTEDVIATYNLYSDSTILDPYQNSLMAEYDKPVALSKYVFSVRSKTKIWKNMLYFGLTKILPAHEIMPNGKMITGAEFLKKYQYELPVGNGPYTVLASDVRKGKELQLTRVEDWWAKDEPANLGQYNFNKIRIVFVEDENLRLQKFKKGETDFYIVGRALWWKEEFNDDPIQRGIMQKRRVYTDEPQGVQGIAFNTRKEPFNDPKVRLAFVYLFNREKLLEKLMFNQYTIMDSYYPNSPFEHPGNPQFRYNPEKAMQLLAEAGYTTKNAQGILVKNGQPLSIDMPIDKSFERIITPVQEDLKKAGIQLNLRIVDAVTGFQMAMDRNFSLRQQSWTGTLWPNPYNVWHSSLADKKNTNNITGFKNSRVDQLIDMEKTEFDPAKRSKIMQQIDSILMESNHYALMWYGPYTRVVYWNYLNQPKFYLSKVGDWKDVAQYWWDNPENRAEVLKGRTDKSVKMEVGPTDIMFWPDFKKQHPNGIAPAAASAPSADSNAKPTLK